ncbi:uncharacterized protein [Pempheris klunzingeri]|uniref:uncharacterized protein n=1 Tax=Pempheris klunzingeri TaxID=3127111 RepID=UPI0039817FE6
MVQFQLYTLEHLMNSRFGRPFPRHGLQLLFWFSNHCVTFELSNFELIMKLASDCQPERGFYGFHLFGNIEKLLPALERGRKTKRQVAYFEVGNLNTETYPASADLPKYVRENYGMDGNCGNYNIDRIIISYQVRTRIVGTVYVTEHDESAFGRFSRDRTYEISSELIQVLQSPQLVLPTFLTQMGYYGDTDEIQANNTLQIYYPEPSAYQMFNTVQTYSGSTGRTDQSDSLQFFSEAYNSRFVENYNEVQSYWPSRWEQPYDAEGFNKAKKRNGGGGPSFFKILLSVGALYLAAKCFGWLRGPRKEDLMENIVKMLPGRTSSYQPSHVMLDYVF